MYRIANTRGYNCTSTINPSIYISFANVFVFECLSHINKIHLLSIDYAELRDVCLKSNECCLLVRENHPNAYQFITKLVPTVQK